MNVKMEKNTSKNYVFQFLTTFWSLSVSLSSILLLLVYTLPLSWKQFWTPMEKIIKCLLKDPKDLRWLLMNCKIQYYENVSSPLTDTQIKCKYYISTYFLV